MTLLCLAGWIFLSTRPAAHFPAPSGREELLQLHSLVACIPPGTWRSFLSLCLLTVPTKNQHFWGSLGSSSPSRPGLAVCGLVPLSAFGKSRPSPALKHPFSRHKPGCKSAEGLGLCFQQLPESFQTFRATRKKKNLSRLNLLPTPPLAMLQEAFPCLARPKGASLLPCCCGKPGLNPPPGVAGK